MTSESQKVDPVLQPQGLNPAQSEQAEPAAGGTPSGSATLGGSLRTLRESRGWSVGDVCARLKFAPRQIEALEADDWGSLPQGPSLRGMVRNYARLLEADPDAFVAALPAHLQATPAPMAKVGNLKGVAELPPGSTLPGTAGSSRGSGLGWLAIIIILLALVGLAAYLFFAWWLPRSQGVSQLPEISLPFAESVTGEGGAMVSGTIQVVPEPVGSQSEGVTADGASGAQEAAATVSAPSQDGSAPETGAPASGLVGSTPAVAGAGAPASAAGVSSTPGAVATVTTPGAEQSAPAAANAGVSAAAPAVAQNSPTGPFVVPGLSAEAVPPSAPAEPPPPVVPPNQLVLQAQGASWVEVRDASGSILLSATLQAGESRELQPEPPARIVIGNANGVTVTWQGDNVDLAQYQRGNVARFTLQ